MELTIICQMSNYFLLEMTVVVCLDVKVSFLTSPLTNEERSLFSKLSFLLFMHCLEVYYVNPDFLL